MNSNDLHTFTFHRADWDLVLAALQSTAYEQLCKAYKIGLRNTPGAELYEQAQKFLAIANDINFIIPS